MVKRHQREVKYVVPEPPALPGKRGRKERTKLSHKIDEDGEEEEEQEEEEDDDDDAMATL